MRRVRGLELIGTLAAVTTLLSPVDLIPDFVPIIGWLDDALAVVYLVAEILKFIRKRRTERS